MIHDDPPRRAAVRQSLARPILVGGADRDLMVPLYLFVLEIVAVSSGQQDILIPTLLFAGAMQYVLIQAAKYDPDWRVVTLRFLRYRRTYTASSHPREPRTVPPYSVPPRKFL